MTRVAIVRVWSAALCCVALVLSARPQAQQIGWTPVEIVLPQPPAPVLALGRIQLVYELHVTNFGAAPIVLEQLDVLDGDRRPLATWAGPQLAQRVSLVGQVPAAAGPSRTLTPGSRAVIYLWIAMPVGERAPAALLHRLTMTSGSDRRDELLVTASAVVANVAAIGAPLREGPWVAVRGPSASSAHRLAIVALDGRARVPQRFAVDYARLGADGLLFHGDGHVVANWYGYDAPVHAVADGVVVLARDGRIDHGALDISVPTVMESAEALGNVVVISIGDGRFVTYAHLASGSVRVASGARVTEGDVLGRIGNSGNTLGPHLHFQVSDAVEPLGGEGLPFAARSFDLIGRVTSVPALLAGTPWIPNAAQPPRTVTNELPLENMVLAFER